jgi:NAD-dependent DNA ligase
MNTETAITEVEKVIWNISKHKMLKPTIQLKPINLNGVLISFTTGFNAKYIKDNNLGTGSVVEITRSGDVIPYIVNIIKSSEKADMPDSPFAWNETNTDILVLNDENNVSDIKKIASLFSELKIKYVSEATITKMFEYGLDDLFKILSATVDDFLKIETFGNTMAEKIYSNIHDGLKNISVPLLCGAFSIFGLGMGKRKMTVLFDSVPDLFDLYHSLSTDALISKLNTVEGFSQKSSEKIVQNLPFAIEFVNKITPFVTFKSSSSSVKGCCNMENMIFVCSGFRDLALEEYIISKGGQVKTSVSKNTTGVIVRDTSASSAKIVKAKDLNISIFTTEDFFKNF